MSISDSPYTFDDFVQAFNQHTGSRQGIANLLGKISQLSVEESDFEHISNIFKKSVHLGPLSSTKLRSILFIIHLLKSITHKYHVKNLTPEIKYCFMCKKQCRSERQKYFLIFDLDRDTHVSPTTHEFLNDESVRHYFVIKDLLGISIKLNNIYIGSDEPKCLNFAHFTKSWRTNSFLNRTEYLTHLTENQLEYLNNLKKVIVKKVIN